MLLGVADSITIIALSHMHALEDPGINRLTELEALCKLSKHPSSITTKQAAVQAVQL